MLTNVVKVDGGGDRPGAAAHLRRRLRSASRSSYFSRVSVNPDLGTICWPDDADWDPLVLYSLVVGRPVEAFLNGPYSG